MRKRATRPDFLPELLAPAGNLEKLRVCLLYGADAVYLGGTSGNLRAACEGFDDTALRIAVSEANACGASIYYCLNSLPMQRDLGALPGAIEAAASAGVHAFIIADPGVLRLARKYAPDIPVHLSTQANTTNSEALDFWAEQGVSRVVLARELDCRELYDLRKASPAMEVEVFVHGAMCLAVSGQCLLSAWLNGRSGNQGRCTQPCRFEYRSLGLEMAGEEIPARAVSLLVDEYTRPGQLLWRVEQEERYSSFWAPQDLCLLPWLPWFVRNGIAALKVEGRMKSGGWIAHVIDAYRAALDAIGGRREPVHRKTCMAEVFYAATRPLGSGFFLHGKRRNLTEELLAGESVSSRRNRSGESALPELGHPLLAQILEPAGNGTWLVDVRGNWERRMDVEIMLPGLKRPVLVGGSYGLENQRGELTDAVGNGIRAVLYADMEDLRPGVFIRGAE